MILTCILFYFVFYILQRHFKDIGYPILFTIVFALASYFIFLIEVYFSNINYFISDENDYWNLFLDTEYNKLDRFFWVAVNFIERKIDILGFIGVKLINIPILIFFLYLLWKIFFRDKRVFYITLFFPYLVYLSTKNLRDIIILFFMVLSIYYWFKRSKIKRIIAILPLLFLLFLRPFITFLLISLIIYFEFIHDKISIKIFSIYVSKKLFRNLIITISIILFFLMIPYVEKRIRSYTHNFNHMLVEGHKKRLIKSGGIDTGYILTDYLVGSVRYCVTPIPTSITARLLKGGDGKHGLLDDFFRTIQQFFYYFLLFYVLVNLKFIIKKIPKLKRDAKIIILVLLAHLPIYTFYAFGMGHQRIKLPFQIGIFLLFIINKNISLKKMDSGYEARCVDDN